MKKNILIIISCVLFLALAQGPAFSQCLEGDCKNGYGELNRWAGHYIGQFKDHRRHGEGVFTFPDGSVYSGQWVEDRMTGYGEFSFTDGEYYQGEFLDGQRHGQGTYYYQDGESVTGQWEHDKLLDGILPGTPESMMGDLISEELPEGDQPVDSVEVVPWEGNSTTPAPKSTTQE